MAADIQTQVYVLAGMLASENMLYDGLAVLSSDHFQEPILREAYELTAKLAQESPPNFPIIYKQLRNRPDSEKLLELRGTAVADSSFGYWLNALCDQQARRNYWNAAKAIQDLCRSERPVSEIRELVEERILMAGNLESADQIIPPQQAGMRAKAEFERRQAAPVKIHGVKLSRPTARNGVPGTDGFPSLDEALGGLKGGDLIIVAAETGEGKTALAQNLVRHASIHQNFQTYYQNTEMNPDEMVFRFISQMSGKSFRGIYGGTLQGAELEAVRKEFDTFAQSRVYISSLPILTPERSRGLARQFKTRYGKLDLLVIDYVGRMELESPGGKQEWQVMRDISRNCKRLAQEINACVILIAQLNEEGKLQGAKSMANEADGMFFFGPVGKEEINTCPVGATHKITNKKVRRGEKGGTIWCSFVKDRMYITEIPSDER
ncbi:DnaB-like helicase C-terminal domain-containing protein [Paenibacillus sp. P22]|uniref:DnaB-like helicase C-terminal domain-containing protein n=1 Tax=Paenibacillus sp. P22 TaxID=483908 RepID=UPI0004354D95|nr:DnaB-like helicase C-terminal domain-containing protein [Paenibacillus sp. P22]CDN41678.1 DnaB domain protein helicase, C-terminal domain protein [Paenibacillus sp. P22]